MDRRDSYGYDPVLKSQQTPKRKTAAQLRKELDQDPQFKAEMDECIKNMDNLPGMRNKVIAKLATAEQSYED